ncbi:unnamed protein product [Vitrella brassicaformis CCMP3155]|uniref:Uncharacterized protein n=3 Tax=Vitrella brassicaformis TaxID=1169539 RepID=A0A0G4EQ29_VITBC|nr:unnamed protein product [Vitrella brassicaformis CCMP3155]|eukprot:CEL99960.1 unnamed protein product [Vitrella brassicaformis CCMP3155]
MADQKEDLPDGLSDQTVSSPPAAPEMTSPSAAAEGDMRIHEQLTRDDAAEITGKANSSSNRKRGKRRPVERPALFEAPVAGQSSSLMQSALQSARAGGCQVEGGSSVSLGGPTVVDTSALDVAADTPPLEETAGVREEHIFFDEVDEDGFSDEVSALFVPQGFRRLSIGVMPPTSITSIRVSRELLSGVVRRTITSADDVTRLCGEGADATMETKLMASYRSTQPISLLSLAIDDATGSSIGVYRSEGMQLNLPRWPSRELQQAVLEALIANGADVNGVPVDRTRGSKGASWKPLRVAVVYGNVTAVDVLLRHGARTRGLEAAYLPLAEALPPEESPEYEAALLKTYRRVLDEDPSLASETINFGCPTCIHVAAMVSPAFSPSFLLAYLDLMRAHGAQIDVLDALGMTPLAITMGQGAPEMVDWLCGQLGVEGINKTIPGLDSTTLNGAGVALSQAERSKAPQAEVDRLKRGIRVLLKHGASLNGAEDRIARSQVLRIKQEMQREVEQEAKQRTPAPEEEVSKAAKMAAELIREEAREKAKKAKKGGKKGAKGGARQHEQQQHEQQQQSVSIEREAIDKDEEPSMPSTPADSRELDDQRPSSSSADPPPTSSSSIADVSRPCPADAVTDSESGDFVPVVTRSQKRKDKTHKQQHDQPPFPPPTPPARPLSVSRSVSGQLRAGRPPAGRGPGPNFMPADPRTHRGPPPLVPTAAVRPPASANEHPFAMASQPHYPPVPPPVPPVPPVLPPRPPRPADNHNRPAPSHDRTGRYT